MSHFLTSEPTTAFYTKLGCIQFSLQKLMLTHVHNDVDNVDDADDTNDYNMVIDIALLKVSAVLKNYFCII